MMTILKRRRKTSSFVISWTFQMNYKHLYSANSTKYSINLMLELSPPAFLWQTCNGIVGDTAVHFIIGCTGFFSAVVNGTL